MKLRQPFFFELKYEDLIMDENLRRFHKLFEFLGFEQQQMQRLLKIAYANSLFSRQVKKLGHIRCGIVLRESRL